jgi:hypothetical protein
MMRKGRNQIKSCPFREEACQKQDCEIYNEKLDRCEIGLLAYNMYLLAATLRQNSENPDLK